MGTISAIFSVIAGLTKTVGLALGLIQQAKEREAGVNEQKAADSAGQEKMEQSAQGAGDAYDRMSDVDRERLRKSEGAYRDDA